jgi:hypothetical protein
MALCCGHPDLPLKSQPSTVLSAATGAANKPNTLTGVGFFLFPPLSFGFLSFLPRLRHLRHRGN